MILDYLNLEFDICADQVASGLTWPNSMIVVLAGSALRYE